jgi:hypothetical protein
MTITRILHTLLMLAPLLACVSGCGLSSKKMVLDVEIIDGCVVRVKEAKVEEAGSILDNWTIGQNCTLNVGSAEDKK